MNAKLIYPIILLFLSQGAFAHQMGCHPGPEQMGPRGPELVFPGVLNDRPIPKKGPCAELKLDKKERAQIRNVYFKFKAAQIDLASQLHKAHLNQEEINSDPKTDFSVAERASKAVSLAVTNLMQATDTYRNTVLYKILKPTQRSAAQACWRHHGPHRGPK